MDSWYGVMVWVFSLLLISLMDLSFKILMDMRFCDSSVPVVGRVGFTSTRRRYCEVRVRFTLPPIPSDRPTNVKFCKTSYSPSAGITASRPACASSTSMCDEEFHCSSDFRLSLSKCSPFHE